MILPMKDPVTGKTRLLVGYDQGSRPASTTTARSSPRSATRRSPTGVRNGNLQITQFYNGAAQPSALAAQIAGALFYGEAQDDGFPTSDPNVLTNGNIGWIGLDRRRDRRRHRRDRLGDELPVHLALLQHGRPRTTSSRSERSTGRPDLRPDPVDQRPAGRQPARDVRPAVAVRPVVQLRRQPDQQPADDHRLARRPPLRHRGPGRDLVRPGRPVASSTARRSRPWPTGRPTPTAPAQGRARQLHDRRDRRRPHLRHLHRRRQRRRQTNAWINISSGLDGSPVQRIVTDPTRGTHDAYAITARGVFYNADTSAANTTGSTSPATCSSRRSTPSATPT